MSICCLSCRYHLFRIICRLIKGKLCTGYDSADSGELGVIGFKDSSANTVYFQSVMYAMKDNPDFSMLVGPEEIMAESRTAGGLMAA